MRFLTLRPISPNPAIKSHSQFLSPNFFCVSNRKILRGPMAEESNGKNQSLKIDNKTAEEKVPEKLAKAIPPPPPERPLPGDCCGSGCVRCVWDVYYEDLEEYNKLYKSNSDSN